MSVEIRQHIQQTVEGLAGIDRIDPSENLFEGGYLTSVHVLDLIASIESDLSLKVADDDLTADNFATIDSIVAFAERSASQRGT